MSLEPVLRSIGTIAVTLFLLTAFTPLAVALVHWTAVRPRVQPAEAIVVLGGGLSPDGVWTAVPIVAARCLSRSAALTPLTASATAASGWNSPRRAEGRQ